MGHRMKDKPAGWQANDRHRSAMSGAQNRKRISFNPQVLGQLVHRLDRASARGRQLTLPAEYQDFERIIFNK
jgi:hypothetical protein